MSYPRCQTAGMKSDDAAEPLEWDAQELRQSLAEWAAISRQMIELLHATAGCNKSRNWSPHLSQIVRAVHAFGARCHTEAEEVGCWRADGLDPEEAFELVRAQGNRLVEWLQRMMAD